MSWQQNNNQEPEVDPEIARMQRLNRLQEIDAEVAAAGSGTATRPDDPVNPDLQPLLSAIHAAAGEEGVHNAIRQYLDRQGCVKHSRRRI